MTGDDLRSHALNSSIDFYDLLNLPPTANESDIRRAYRKTALKYHPDKVGANDTSARDKFDLLQIANDILSDPGVRELYDNARRAEEEKKQRDAAFEGRRRWMKEDLERRERGVLKRKREEVDVEEEFERELRRLAEDGKRRRKEREEILMREAREVEEEDKRSRESDLTVQTTTNGTPVAGPADLDRSVTLRYLATKPPHLDKDGLFKLWERFGPIQDCVLREKKFKKDGEKHRQPYATAVLVYKSIVGAHAAVSDIARLQQADEETWGMFEAVGWAAGREPEYIPRAQPSTPPITSSARAEDAGAEGHAVAPNTPQRNADAGGGGGLKKVPSFASFKGTPAAGTHKGPNSPSVDEITMIRLKNAERRRLEEKIRREEAQQEV